MKSKLDKQEALLKILRDRKADTTEFRDATRRLCALLMRKQKTILQKRGVPQKDVVFVVILRASLAFLDAAMQSFPKAPVGVLGLKRDEKTFAPRWYYENLPRLSKKSTVVICDPMLATGGSAEAAIKKLARRGADRKKMYFVGVIAATEGLSRLAKHIPQRNIMLAAVDEKLDARKMIVPGLGDFGDRYFGYEGASVSFGAR